MRIAVTGARGGLGRHLTTYLLEQKHEVVGIDVARPADERQPFTPGSRVLFADTRDFGEMVGALEGCEALIHLAAYTSPMNHPAHVVYANNSVGSYNALGAAAALGIKRVCLASSINAIGGVYSRQPRYDYFPVDEQHPTYAEDPYSLSKWVLEQQGDAFARRYEDMTIASLRFHWLLDEPERAAELTARLPVESARHLWAYTQTSAAARACLLAVNADYRGHQAFYIVAPKTASPEPSLDLAHMHYPDTEVRGDLSDHNGFFDCSRAERMLGWRHEG